MEAGEKDTKLRIEHIDFKTRRYRRVDINLPIEIEYDQIKSSITHTGNISEGGVLIFFPKQMNISQYLRLKVFFSLDSELNAVKALGEVVWSDNHLSEDWEYYPYGVKFIDISPEDRTKLRDFIGRLSLPSEN